MNVQQPTFDRLCAGYEIAPHVVEAICLFVTATRLLKPNVENYRTSHPSYKKIEQLLPRLSVVHKALLFESSLTLKEMHAQFSLMNATERNPEFRQADVNDLYELVIDLVDEGAPKNAETSVNFYDGDIGISTRDAEAFVTEFIGVMNALGSKEIIVLDFLEFLEKRRNNFLYFTEIEARLTNFAQQRVRESVQSGATGKGDFGNKVRLEIAELKRQHPTAEPESIAASLRTFYRNKTRKHFIEALELVADDRVDFLVLEYLEHAKVSINAKNSDAPRPKVAPKYCRSPQNREEGNAEPEVLKEFEERLLRFRLEKQSIGAQPTISNQMRETLRQEIWSSIMRQVSPGTAFDIATQARTILPQTYNDVGEACREEQKAKVDQFLEDLQRYQDCSAFPTLDQVDAVQRDRFERYGKAVKTLTANMGYPPKSLARLGLWALAESEK